LDKKLSKYGTISIQYSDKKLLDIGCGDKSFINSFKKIQAFGIDKASGHDAEDGLDYKAGSINYITMLAVIEHFVDCNKVLADCHRILKDDGQVIITTPFQKVEMIT